MENISSHIDTFITLVIEFTPKLASGILVLVIGFWAVKKISRVAKKGFEKAKFSPEVTPFILSFLEVILKVLTVLIAAGIIGFDTSALVGLLAAAGFAIGLALQGGLGNFAAGVIILVFKPYKVNDWIGVDEKFGKVEEIQIFNTLMVTPGLKTLIIPNGQIIDNIVTNYSKKGHIRVELSVMMPYAESFPKVQKIIREVLNSIPKVKEEPLPEVGIEAYESHSIVVAVRPFIDPNDYWEVTYEVYEKIKAAFNEHGVNVAYSEGIEIGKIGE
ncbi:MAG: mechanosensitive ion channel [Bacteroidetes bacterium]|jgi:small conductance mechanosensitive channel|nr:mechanosensitive ion channel [Bacteroidota bacterium]MDF1864809.1 mechanosensitive ion channel [Saprospiraceae bacterium]